MAVSRAQLVSRRFVASAAVGLMALTTIALAPQAMAGPDKREFTASVTPTTSNAGAAVSYTLQLTNSPRSNNDLGSAQLVIPAGFTNLTVGDPSPAGWTATQAVTCSSGSPDGCGAPGSTLVEVSTPASSGAQKVGPGQTLSFTISAQAPNATGTYPWNVAAKNSASWSEGQNFTLKANQPSVTVVAAAPSKLAFTVQPAGVMAGQAFGVSVALQTSTGQPTTGTQAVTLAANGTTLGGTTTRSAVAGVATFTGLQLTQAGSFTLTATSPGLAQATSAPIAVSAASPAQLALINAPQTTIVAGQNVTAKVSVQDAFGNQTDSSTPVTLTIAGPGGSSTTTAAAVNGVADLTSDAIEKSGTYSVAIGGVGTELQSSVTVAPADPSRLVFDPTPASSVQAGGSYPVTAKIRDSYGNATSSTKTVTLTIGGTSAQVAASNGTASFNGTAPQTVGSYSVGVSSPGLTSPTPAQLTVTPGPAAQLSIISAPLTAGAGQPISVQAQVADSYGNLVDTPVSVSLSIGGAPVTTASTVGGAVTLAGAAPTTLGNVSLVVTSAGLPTQTATVEIVPGPAVALEITSLIDQTTGFVSDPNSLNYPLAPIDIVIENLPFTVNVRTVDAYGNPSPVTSDTGITLGSTTAGGSLSGTLTGTIAAGLSSGSISGATYSPFMNGVLLTVTAVGLSPAQALVDVQKLGWVQDAAPGVATTVANPACLEATPEVPVCGSLLLPNGANGKVLLSQGACNPIVPAALGGCLTSSTNEALLVNAKAKLQKADGTKLYTRAKPATMVLRCDKTLCGGGGINSFSIVFDLDTDTAGFGVAPFCPSKGRLGAGQPYCFDTRQSTRDNAGDLIAYVLFVDDARASFKP